MSMERVVLISGLPGTGVGRLLRFINDSFLGSLESLGVRPDDVKVTDFEYYLRRVYGMASIEKVALLLLSSSRDTVLNKFRQALEEVKAEAAGKRILVMGIHLSYFTRGIIAPNPILHEVVRLAPKAYILYLVEDYYDALWRIARRMQDRVVGLEGLYAEKYTLDPLTYLVWRGAEFNVLNMVLSSAEGRVKVYVLGTKHRMETVTRMLRHLIAGERFLHVYLSHPITIFRDLRRLGGDGLDFKEVPGVDAIEAIKEALISGVDDIILYEPTTVDELILTSKSDACTKMGGQGGGGWGDVGLSLDPVIGRHNRWPLPPRTLMDDYPYRAGGSRDLARDSLYRELFGPLIRELRVEHCSQDLSYIGDMLSQLIISQIEIRDYAYVEQSDATLVLIPLFFNVEGDREGSAVVEVYVHIASGVDAEIRRAHALAKRVTAVFIPVSLKRLSDRLCGGDRECSKRLVEVVASQSTPPARRRIQLSNECLEVVSRTDSASAEPDGRCSGDLDSLKSVFEELVWTVTSGMGSKRPLGPLSAIDGAVVAHNARKATIALTRLLHGFEVQPSERRSQPSHPQSDNIPQ